MSTAQDVTDSDDGPDTLEWRRPRRTPPRPSIADGPPSMLYTVKQVELACRMHLDELLKSAGITALQFTALTVLERRDGLTVTELARNSFVKVPSMADILKPLYQRELISRRADPNHGRRQLIGLTAAGQTLLDDYRQPVEAVERQMLAQLSDEEARLLRGLLVRCRTALS